MQQAECLRKFQKKFKFFNGGSNIDTSIIDETNCQQILTILLQSMMKDKPNVARKACVALGFLAESYEEYDGDGLCSLVESYEEDDDDDDALCSLAKGYKEYGGSSTPLTPFFQQIVQTLLTVTRREDAGESSLRITAYDALDEVVRTSSYDYKTTSMGLQLVPEILIDLHNALESGEMERHGQLCVCLEAVILKLESSAESDIQNAFRRQYVDQIMGLVTRNANVGAAAVRVIGALASFMGRDLEKWMSEFCKYIQTGLQNFEVCGAIVDVVEKVCKPSDDRILPNCDGIMCVLFKILSDDQLDRFVKPRIFSCFADIAINIKENFVKYVIDVMDMLRVEVDRLSAAEGIDDDDDDNAMDTFRVELDVSVERGIDDDDDVDDDIDTSTTLKNAILDAYSGIFNSLKTSPNVVQCLLPYARHVIQFMDYMYIKKDMEKDEQNVEAAILILEDMADALGSNVGSLIQQSLSRRHFLSECLSSRHCFVRESAERAMSAINRAISS